MLDEAIVARGREDDVVEQGYPERVSCLLEPAGDLTVLRARFEPPTRMIVRYNHGTCPVGDGVRIYLAGMDVVLFTNPTETTRAAMSSLRLIFLQKGHSYVQRQLMRLSVDFKHVMQRRYCQSN